MSEKARGDLLQDEELDKRQVCVISKVCVISQGSGAVGKSATPTPQRRADRREENGEGGINTGKHWEMQS